MVAILTEGAVAIAPVLIDLDEGLEEDGLAEELLKAFAGFGGYALQCHALVADDDALLAIALDIDDTGDVDVFVGLLETFNHYLAGVGNLLIIIEENLLTHDFCDEEAGRFVGPLVLVEIGRVVGEEFLDALQHIADIELVQGTDREDFGLGQGFVPQGNLLLQGLLVGEVNLVDEHQDGHFQFGHFLKELGVLVRRFHHVGDIKQDIGIDEGALGELEHLLLELVVGFEYAGSVGKADLHLGRVEYAHDAVARGLCLEGGNGDALAHEKIHERAFPNIGIAYDIDKTRPKAHSPYSSILNL